MRGDRARGGADLVGASMSYLVSVPDTAAERAVLGALIASPAAWADVSPILRPSDFFSDANRVIYAAIGAMHDGGMTCDMVTLPAYLQDTHQVDAVGGISYVAALADELPDSANAAHYAGIVRAASLRRSIITVGTEAIGLAQSEETADRALDAVSDRLAALQERRADGGLVQLGAQAHEELRLMRAEAEGEAPVGLRTGYARLDNDYLRGMRPGQFLVLGADTGVGKTSLALSIALNAAIDQGAAVLYVSLEMGAAEIARRALAIRSDVSEWRLVHGRHQVRSDEEEDGGDWVSAAWAASQMAHARFSVVDSGHVTPGQLRGRARSMRMRHGLDLVVVDYLQLMVSGSRHTNRQEEVSEISRALKLLARDLSVPVLALSQLSRERSRRAEGKGAVTEGGFVEAEIPRLSDLRESGSIANDADVVLLLHRRVEGTEEQRRSALLVVAKKRSGPTGRVNLRFRPSVCRFVEGTCAT